MRTAKKDHEFAMIGQQRDLPTKRFLGGKCLKRELLLPTLMMGILWGLLTVPLVRAEGTISMGPYLQNVTPRSIVIMWETSDPVVSHIAIWSQGQERLDLIGGEPVLRHEKFIDTLEPDTLYGYAVTMEGQQVFESTFRTAPDRARSFRFAVYGDSRSNPQVHKAIVEGILDHRPDLVLHTGDIVGIGDRYTPWSSEFFEPARQLLHDTPMFPVLGNHEYFYSGRSWFSSFFALPNNEQWFAFTYGNVRFIGLDTNVSFFPDSVQYRWFQSELQSVAYREATWRIVYLHHPAFTSSRYRDDFDIVTYLVPLMERAGVNMVFAGHAHVYEQFLHNDVYYIVTGGGGSPLYPLAVDHEPPIRLVGESVYHYCMVDVNVPLETMTLSAYRLDNTSIDEITVVKTDPGPEVIAVEPIP